MVKCKPGALPFASVLCLTGYARVCSTRDGKPCKPQDHKAVVELAGICSLCNESSVEYSNGVYAKIGEPTETALVVLVEKLNVTQTKVTGLTPDERALACNTDLRKGYNKQVTLEFSRDRKSMSTFASTPEGDKLLVKVATRWVGMLCAARLLTWLCV